MQIQFHWEGEGSLGQRVPYRWKRAKVHNHRGHILVRHAPEKSVRHEVEKFPPVVPYPVADRLLILRVGPRTPAGLFVWCDVWMRQPVGKWHSIELLILDDFARALRSRFWLP